MTGTTAMSDALPLGSIEPKGWLRRQLEIQAAGLTGSLDEFWPDVRDSGWIGGSAEGWERGPYWLDGLVPIAFSLKDARLIEKAHRWVGYIVEHQRTDGWIGPEDQAVDGGSHKRDPWPLFVALKALTQYQEATADERVLSCIEKTVEAIDNHLDRAPLHTWGMFRWQDLLVTVLWLLERRPGDCKLVNLAHRIHTEGYGWEAHFRDFRFSAPAHRWQYDSHVVNNAMGIKAPGLWRWFLEGRMDADEAMRPIQSLDRFHGQATGVFSGDECLAGLHPSRGTELCAVVEYLFSLEVLLARHGDVRFSDRLESIAFNALPATFKPDMWAHQYDQQVNQAICSRSEQPIFGTNGPDSNLYGLEPNFGCCTANMHQGFPKFTSHLAFFSDEGRLRLATYAPAIVRVQAGDGGAGATAAQPRPSGVVAEIRGNYPFDGRVSILVESGARRPMTVELPIPEWAEGTRLLVTSADGKTAPAQVVPAGAMHAVDIGPLGRTRLELDIPLRTRVRFRYNGAASVYRGPLLYSLAVDEEWKQVGGTEPHADWEVHPGSHWNLAMELNPEAPSAGFSFVSAPVGEQEVGIPFDPEHPVSELEAAGGLLPEWVMDKGSAGAPPPSPVTRPSDRRRIRLVPYGATNLRIAEIPWFLP